VLLPALAWGEKDGTVTNSERVISRQRGFLPASGRGEAGLVDHGPGGQRLGFGARLRLDRPAEIFREHAALSALARPTRRVFDIGGLSRSGRCRLRRAGTHAMARAARGPVRRPHLAAVQRFVATPYRSCAGRRRRDDPA
jgi:assimilatory nitrate reductase catalytic subunit